MTADPLEDAELAIDAGEVEQASRAEFIARWLSSQALGPLYDVPAIRAELEREWAYRWS